MVDIHEKERKNNLVSARLRVKQRKIFQRLNTLYMRVVAQKRVAGREIQKLSFAEGCSYAQRRVREQAGSCGLQERTGYIASVLAMPLVPHLG